MSLHGQVALVTGGSRGLGRSISVELASKHAFVFVNYSSSPDAADETVRLCREVGGEAEALGFNGTPSFVVGDQLIPGFVEKAQLAEVVAAARAAE